MSIETKTIERKISVCAKKGCMTCPLNEYVVPDDCEWAMKHLLCTEEEGVVIDMPRRSGKTMRMMKQANELLQYGHQVMIFTPTADMGNLIQQQMMGTGVQIASVGGFRIHAQKGQSNILKILSSRPPMFIFSDEVYPWIADFVKRKTKHRFVVGFYSSVG